MQLAKRAKKRRRREKSSDTEGKLEESEWRPNQATGRTNPWRVSAEGSHETGAWIPRHMVPYLPP